MGIKGLTKFVNDRSQQYLENYELHDCNVIIDGHSLSCQLYNWRHWEYEARSTNCYGGDYDKYAFVVECFFEMLNEANVTPYVIFDGGYEERKLPTILNRMQEKIKIAEQLNPEFEIIQPNKVVFPLFLREVFKDVVRNRDVKLAMCRYEGDMEIASIAKVLNCPVLTLDSDYFLFGCQYIPFTSLENKVRTIDNWRTGRYKCISCKLYNIDRLLESYKGLSEETLHLLPVFIGNDYINESEFDSFFESIDIESVMPLQQKINALLLWLKDESLESAIRKILNNFNTKKEKCSIFENIEKIITGYHYVESRLLSYFNINPKIEKRFKNSDLKFLRKTILEEGSSLHNDLSSVNENGDCDNNTNKIKITHANSQSKIFLKNYTKGRYPSSFMDIITQNKYYCIPQIEDYSQKNSHIHSLELLCAIHKILTNSVKTEFSVIARDEGTTVKWFSPEMCELELPSLEEFEQLPLKDRRGVLFKLLKIDDNIITCLENTPTEWHLFLIALKYCKTKITITTPFLHSLVLCFIILNYIDQKVGFFRSSKKYKKRYPSQYLSQPNEHFRANRNCFYYFPDVECIIFMQKIIKFFEFEPSDVQHFDRKLIHLMAELQSIFLHIKYLNLLLNYPYSNLLIHRIFDGTFLYNVTKTFNDASTDQSDDYLNTFLENCPSICAGVKYILDLFKNELIL